MMQMDLAPASAGLREFVWAFCAAKGRVDGAPLFIPLPARPKQLLTFFFADPYRLGCQGPDHGQRCAAVIVVGPQTHTHRGLCVLGTIDNFTIQFQPSGFNGLFGVPMTHLTDAEYDAQAVVGRALPALAQELGDAGSFAERIRIMEKHLTKLLVRRSAPDAVAMAANALFARQGVDRISAIADRCGLSPRQFERRFLAQVGVPPKLYARIVRFNAALDRKLRHPSHSWSRIAADQDYYDQMHLVRDCRAFTGESPTRLLGRLEELPAFHNLFAAGDRRLHEDRRVVLAAAP